MRVCSINAIRRTNYCNRKKNFPDSMVAVLGDFNKANLSHELPKVRLHVTCPTRDQIEYTGPLLLNY